MMDADTTCWRTEVTKVIERTLSIIKPDATKRHLIGKIVALFEDKGLVPVKMEMRTLTRAEAERFYAVHSERPFYRDLVQFMISGPVVVMVLEGEEAIGKNREIMGATDPAKAAAGTIRKDFARTVQENSVHGSDSPQTARVEIEFFFPGAA
jgi:nucleoside-diphosphate kinase